MVKSLDILQHMPGHAGRVETCAALTESLLAIVRPKLTVELNQEDVDPLLEYVIIYTKLGRCVLHVCMRVFVSYSYQ